MSTVGRGSGGVSETGPGPMQSIDGLQVDITVLRVDNLPALRDKLRRKRHFYVSITDGTRTKKSKAMRHQNQAVIWNEKLDGFFAQGSDIQLSLYASRQSDKDILIGTLQIKADHNIEIPFPISSDAAPGLTLVLAVETRQLVQATNSAIADAENAISKMNFADEWKGTIESVKWVMDTVGDLGQVNSYFQIVWEALSLVPKLVANQMDYDDNVRALIEAMRNAFDLSRAENLLGAIKPNSNRARILTAMLRHMQICREVVIRYAEDKEFMKRLRRNIICGPAQEIQDLCKALKTLRQELLDDTVISTQEAVERIQRSMDILPQQISDLDIDIKMNDLPYKSGWRSASTLDKNGCLPETRTQFLEYISAWVDDPSSPVGLALFGQAGTGKSAIAHEIALRFQLEDRLGSYFSFLRNERSKHEDYHLLTTIIHDLANRYPAFKARVGSLIKDNKPLRETDDFNMLFDTLLLDATREIDADIPVLIVIDALDECSNPMGKRGLGAFLAKCLCRLPLNFRVFITSRLEGDIKDKLSSADQNSVRILGMDDSALANTDEDIRFYFQDPQNLSPTLFEEYGNELVQKSEGLFQWAAVACGHIKESPSGWTESECLRGLLMRTADDKAYTHQLDRPLYELYNSVLSGYFSTDNARRRFRSVMGHLLAAADPFSVNSLTYLRQFSPSHDQHEQGAVLAIVKHLGSLLSNVTSAENYDLPIVPLHTSFRDYLVTEEIRRGDPFSVDLEKSHNELTYACVDLMLHELKFNICQLPSSYFPNTKIPDLQARIQERIQPALFYACRFWDDHLERLPFDVIIFGQLQLFFQEKFLFWLEVLSITDTVPLAVQSFEVLKHWIKTHSNNNTIGDKYNGFIALVTDAYRFLRYFATPIAESAAHIYISAYHLLQRHLKSTKSTRTYFQSEVYSVVFSPNGHSVLTALDDSTICVWNSTTGKMEGILAAHSAAVKSVAFSPDGKWIASGSADKTVCLWDASVLELQRGPLAGHTDYVNSVAFSYDGKWIISGSGDKTIIIWNTLTGERKQRLHTGHSKHIWSVTFSPDGTMIASGSVDNTIRVWNTATGQLTHAPFIGHTDGVISVQFSPNGKYIVSGSKDKTIILWDMSTGTIEQGPLTGHNYAIRSVAFSPDGSCIISGSEDNTVRIWDVKTGQLQQILYGHNHWVHAVALSPDGQRIVSGSGDRTFCLWNMPTTEDTSTDKAFGDRGPSIGPMEDSTFTGHTDVIRSVSFSSDSNRIVSGSDDYTICLWNASTGQLVWGPIKGHESAPVNSAIFSPDGRWIATGSEDRTIRLWNTSTGELKGESHSKQADASTHLLPFSGHTGYVWSVAFSPDGQRIASGSDDKTIRVWNTLTGELEKGPFIGHSDAVLSVAFSPDGKIIISGSKDSTICLWDVSTGMLRGEPFRGHTDIVYSVDFSPNGAWIVSGSFDHTLRIWNALTGSLEREPLTGHTGLVTSVAFSPDGSRIVSGSDDVTIRVWNALLGDLQYILPSGHTGMICSVSFSPDGTRIVSGGQDGTIRIMPAHPIIVTAKPNSAEVTFNDLSVVDRDGWIRGDNDELLLWIPSLHRAGLYRPTVPTFIIGKNQTRLDTSKFVHGKDWIACYTGH